MTEQNNEISTPFTEVITNIIQKQAEQIAGIQEKIKTIQTPLQDVTDIKKQLTDIKVAITAIKFPTKQMDELSGKLATSVTLLKQPVENKVFHHHHVPKLIWVSVGLFIVLCLTFCGWYNTSQKLDWHTANDFKYRYLKLKNHPSLQQLLLFTDSLYQTNPGFTEEVLHGEDSVRKMIQQLVNEKEREVNDLKRKMK
ncbi:MULTISPECIES: hypothetical protein [Niastella]|uniref:Uncharacterized protein n=1 Tax=Niastella soli TaxID=2821487 RepID=A0ABS3YZ74_9BACT|nr:hypothetical protein [Niastella soli]MBO9203234.1 hypothetical protein [Niastella soli]